MASTPEPISMLAPHGFREKLSRRAALPAGHGAAAGLAIVVAACGSDAPQRRGRHDRRPRRHHRQHRRRPRAAPRAGHRATGAASSTSRAARSRCTPGATTTTPTSSASSPRPTLGVTMKVDYYTSNEDLITKLSAANGSSGFDIVVPTGPYIPQMIQKGLLQKFDKTKLPNIVQRRRRLPRPATGTPTNDYSVCKNWGTTGYMWDTTVITKPITTWHDFIDAAHGRGQRQLLVARHRRRTSAGMYFWANGIDWNTEKKEDLDAAENVPGGQGRLAHQGVRLLPVARNIAAGRLRALDGLERRRPSGLRAHQGRRWQARRTSSGRIGCAGHRAVDGQLLHRQGCAEPRCGPRLDQLAARARDQHQGPPVPRLQHRHEEHATR